MAIARMASAGVIVLALVAICDLALAGPGQGPGSVPRNITVADTIRFKRFEAIQLSPDESLLAYVLREPNLGQNANELVVYVVPAQKTSARPLIEFRTRAAPIGPNGAARFQIEWTGDSRSLLLLHQPVGRTYPIISAIRIFSKRITALFSEPRSITAFAANSAGTRFAITAVSPEYLLQLRKSQARFKSKTNVVIGPDDFLPYPPLQFSKGVLYPGGSLTRGPRGADTELRVFDIGRPSVALGYANAISLAMSPDGRKLAFSARQQDGRSTPPVNWSNNPLWRASRASAIREGEFRGILPILLDLPATLPARGAADLKGIQGRLAFSSPGALVVGWSPDSRYYAVIGPTPISPGNSITAGDLSFVSYPALFRSGLVPYWSVDAKTCGTSELMHPLGNTNHDEAQLSAFDPAKGHASLLTRTGTQYVLAMTATGNRPAWSVAAQVQLIDQKKGPAPLSDQGRNELISAGSTRIAFLEQSLTAQPQLYSKVIATGQLTALTNINPYISQRRLGNIQRLDWISRGLRYSGFIVFPSNYKAGVKYPCVIMAKSWDDHSFVLEDQDGYRAGNFPIQLMAAQGILVFMAREPETAPDTRYSHDVGTEQFFGPRRELVARGLVDGQRCAAMGFSSTAFELQFALTHSKGENQFAAAVIVDGYSIDYGFNALLSAHSLQQLLSSSGTGIQTKSIEHVQAEMMKASPAWNASEVRTPALIIYHGTSPMDGAELYSALWASGKPVDFNWYPDEEHTLQAPLARMSNAMLELDWFRFWLMGIVPPKSEWDPERPVRWEKLRQQQTRNETWLASGKNPTDEFLKSP